ncbi:MAG: hypothetical protein F4Z14_00550 [Gammaproteobacteria bacterium]|nr:hypothetical protein [Gammaproteobacteria bacterium]
MQLGLLQATVVCVGIGLTGVGILGYKNMQEDAKKEAVAVAVPEARKRAEEMVQHYLAEQKSESAKEKANPLQPPREPDKPDPDSLSDRRPQ